MVNMEIITTGIIEMPPGWMAFGFAFCLAVIGFLLSNHWRDKWLKELQGRLK